MLPRLTTCVFSKAENLARFFYDPPGILYTLNKMCSFSSVCKWILRMYGIKCVISFRFCKNTLIWFGMSVVRFSLFTTWIILWIVNLQHYSIAAMLSDLWRVKLCFSSVIKRSSSPHWMQVKLFLSLLIWIADCMPFLAENRLNRFKFWDGSVFWNCIRTDFGFSHTPSEYVWYICLHAFCVCRLCLLCGLTVKKGKGKCIYIALIFVVHARCSGMDHTVLPAITPMPDFTS